MGIYPYNISKSMCFCEKLKKIEFELDKLKFQTLVLESWLKYYKKQYIENEFKH